MNYTISAFFLFIMMTGSFLSARELSLKEALDLAEMHSINLKKVQARSEASQTVLNAAKAERYPTLSLSASGNYTSDIATLNIELIPGNVFTREFGTKENYQTDIRLSLPLFTGGKISGSVDQARAGVEYQQAITELETDRLQYLTRTVYFNLYRAERIQNIAGASLKRTEIILDNISFMYLAGVADSTDILDARLAFTKAEYALTQAKTARRIAEIQLLTVLGLALTDNLILTDNLNEPVRMSDRPELPETKSELQASQANISINRSQLKLARSDFFPNLSIFTGYSYGKPNLDRFNNTWNDYYTFGANLTWAFNIGGENINKVKSARYNLKAACFEYEQLHENLQQELSVAYEFLNNAYEKFLSAQVENRITETNYRLAGEKHKQGALATNRLLEIETTLTTAQSSLAAALVDYHIALSNYYLASGSPKLREGM